MTQTLNDFTSPTSISRVREPSDKGIPVFSICFTATGFFMDNKLVLWHAATESAPMLSPLMQMYQLVHSNMYLAIPYMP